MNTDDLVKMLSANVDAVDWRSTSRTILISAALGGLVALAAMIALLGIRADIAGLRSWIFIGAKCAFAGAIIVIALVYLIRIARPGGERRVSVALLVLPLVVALIAIVGSVALIPVSDWRAAVFGEHWLLCLLCIPLGAIFPFAGIVLAMRQFAPTNLTLAGALAGLGAGGISAFVYALHCTDDTLSFIAVWYSLAIAVCTLVGALLGPRLLRW
jgi:hypothetical protein